jgi:diguanylate cyclase (GGDEF)-like protein/PAS domain S-box-containing protein
MTTATRDSTDQPQRICTRCVVIQLSLLLLGAIAVVCGSLAFLAYRDNLGEIADSRKLAATAIRLEEAGLGRTLLDYANWAAAYKALHIRRDVAWAVDGNIDASLSSSIGVDAHYALTPGGELLFGFVEGRPLGAVRELDLQHGIDILIERARAGAAVDPEPQVGLVTSGGQLAVAAAAAVAPGSQPELLRQGAPTVLVFLRYLTRSVLDEIGESYLLDGLALADGAQSRASSLGLGAVDGTPLGALTWNQRLPGWPLVSGIAPLTAAALLAVAAFTFLILRSAYRETVQTLQRSAEALRQSESRFRDFARSASDWLWESDSKGRLTWLSDRAEEMIGRPLADVIGRTRPELGLLPPDSGLWREYEGILAAQKPFRDFRYQLQDALGRVHHLRVSGRPVHDETGAFIGYRGTGSDITAEIEAQEQAQFLALPDALTGLPNRTRLADRLADAAALVRRGNEHLDVLCLDLDHFKEVNDTLGHGIGDRLLQEVATRLRASTRAVDTVARLGGDEFAIVQVGLPQPEGAEALCRRLIARISEPIRIEDRDIFVGLSIGVALSPDDGSAPPTLLKNADIALYRAKSEGRGTFRFFSTEMDDALQARKLLEQDLREALRGERLELHYQPLLDVASERIVAVEALVRWFHPERGLVSPSEFIPIAETTGLILPLGEWVLRTACTQAARWEEVIISVNLSPVQFRHDDLVGLVRNVLQATGLSPGRLELEITEGILLQDTEETLVTLGRLKELGVRIAMDDFGTGYSSLRYLHRFPFDKVKIDKSFVSMIEEDANAAAIVRAVVGLGHSLGIITTAEGVENVSQLDFLHAEGCDQVQGYLLGRPQPAADLDAALCGCHRSAERVSREESKALLLLSGAPALA